MSGEVNIVHVLMGKHSYSMDPETETVLSWLLLLLGFIGGILSCLIVSSWIH